MKKLRLKKWVELFLIILLIISSLTMFLVDEVVGCLFLVLNAIIIIIIAEYGTLFKI